MRLRIHLLALIVAGCGGGSASAPDTTTIPADAARTAGGEVIRTAEGVAVTRKTHRRWEDAISGFEAAEKNGWTKANCGSIGRAFDGAASSQKGGMAEGYYMAGLARARCGDQDSARKHYEQALKANPKLCGPRVGLGVMDLEAGRVSQARSQFQRSIKDDPQCTTGYTNLAIIQRKGGPQQEGEALKNLRRALAIESDYLPAFNQMALLHWERGKRKKSGAELDLAEVVCRQAQLIDEKYAPIYNTWGLVKITKGDVIEALRFFEKAISLDSGLFEAQMNFGETTTSFRGYDDARRAFEQAATLQPKSYDAIIGFGTALRGLERFPEAQAQYERAQRLDGSRPEAYFNLGILYQDYMSGSPADLTRAKGYFENFLKRAGGNKKYGSAVKAVKNRCAPTKKYKGRSGRSKCRPGRLQNIDNAVAALKAAG